MFCKDSNKYINDRDYILIPSLKDPYIQLHCCLNLAFVYIRHVADRIRMATLQAVILCLLTHSAICDPLDINEDWGAEQRTTAGDL